MHLVLHIGDNPLAFYDLSTLLTVALLAGAGWGLVRAVVDVVFLARGGDLFRPPPRRPTPSEEARAVAALRRSIDAEGRESGG